MAGYTLSPLARADLEEIWKFTVKQWSTSQAERYVREIERVIDTVASNPALGRKCDEIRTGYLKISAGSHILFYRQLKSKIDVVRILHQSMDIESHF